ncbi:carbohydrate ABC transporter permease [Paenibacillus alvei]|uniref:carbohydrate ABC transporter permease n=1 Tax=Paenibacillus alvei TaxID=44250 RepID=UPI002282EB58|nr:sugar ABC transporter permease [Paenibacillus alvei]
MKLSIRKRRRPSLERKKAMFGWLFIAPWLIGFLLLMAVPLVRSLLFSISHLSLTETGYKLSSVGFENYTKAFTVDPNFNRLLIEATMNMLANVPLIIFFSLFSAVLLSQKFRGRMLARAIFFLPVVLASGVIQGIDSSNYLAQMLGDVASGVEGNFSGLRSMGLRSLLIEMGMSGDIVFYLTSAVDRIYYIVAASGVQILIFLAGLQSISPSLYEASKIEGATGYEAFWKITFPMMSPLILTNTVYTVVDSFTNNGVTGYIHRMAFRENNFGLSSAMSWAYFFIVSIMLGACVYFISKRVFYYD